MLSKRHSRPIVVGDNTYRYAISKKASSDGEFEVQITVQSEEYNGAKLLVRGLITRDYWLDMPDRVGEPTDYLVIKPSHIESMIEQAIEGGWDYSQSGADYMVVLQNDEII